MTGSDSTRNNVKGREKDCAETNLMKTLSLQNCSLCPFHNPVLWCPHCMFSKERCPVSSDSCRLHDSPCGHRFPGEEFALFLNSFATHSSPAPALTTTKDWSCPLDFTCFSPQEQYPQERCSWPKCTLPLSPVLLAGQELLI